MKQQKKSMGRGLFGNLGKIWKSKARRKPNHKSLRLESLESRLNMAGVNGPHDANPDYDPNQVIPPGTEAIHLHANLSIYVNGAKVDIPQGIGNPSFIHTHDGLGTLHIHPATTPHHYITLGEFFETWRTGTNPKTDAFLSSTRLFNNTVDSTHFLRMFVNGSPVDAFDQYQIHDDDRMVLVYTSNPVVVLNTSNGNLPIELLKDVAPGTVNNFLNYVNGGDYNNSIFHRFVSGFVIQGGGFKTPSETFTNTSQFTNVPTDPTIQNEFHLSNTAGTFAMAKLGGDPNSATSQFFLNLGDNSSNLDNQNGGFTVFARLLDDSLLTTTTVGGSYVSNLTKTAGTGAFTDLPLMPSNQLVVLRSVTGNGTIRGTVFNDANGNGTKDASETGLAGTVVFDDVNNNSVLDAGEIKATTDSTGAYVLDVPSGQHTIRQQKRAEFNQTFPSVSDSQTVIVQVGQTASDINFGDIATAVAYRYEITNTSGTVLTGPIDVGTEFLLRVYARDTRVTSTNGFGIFAAYQDITFDATRLQAVGAPTFTTPYTNGQAGTVLTTGELDEIGSFANALSPLGQDEALIVSQRFKATRSGTAVFSGNPADTKPAHEVLVFGSQTPIPNNQVSFPTASISINLGTSDAKNDVYSVDEDAAVTALDVLANDAASGTTANLTVSNVSTANHGATVTVSSDGKKINYTPAANFFGEETFTYTGTDGGSTYTATVVVQVFPKNDPPDAVNDTFEVTEDSQNNFLDVLNNDLIAPDQNDPNEKLQVLSVGTSANGATITRGPSGTHVLYSAPANFIGVDTFTYTVTDRDSNGINDTATATITVKAANDPPTAVVDTFTVTEDSDQAAFDVLVNDTTAPDTGETLTITATTNGSGGGQVAIQTDKKKVLYKPAANFAGTETFTYTISDGNGGNATSTVTMTVTNVNDPPTAVNDTITAITNSDFQTVNVLTNDSATPDTGETLTVASVTQGSNGGTVTLTSGVVKYKPATGYKGSETFTYTINDGNGGNATGTVNITVQDFVPGSIAGAVFIDADKDGVKDANEVPIAGTLVSLQGTDNSGNAVNRTATTGADGLYLFNNLAPGNYHVVETQPAFLLDGADYAATGGSVSANDNLTIQLTQGANLTANNFSEVGRHPAFITIRDLFSSTPAQSAYAAINPTTNDIVWASPGLGWEGVTLNGVELSSDQKQATIDITPSGSTTPLSATLNTSQADKIQVLGQQDGATLVRLLGARSTFNFQPITTASAAAEGEASFTIDNASLVVGAIQTDTTTAASTSMSDSTLSPNAVDALFASTVDATPSSAVTAADELLDDSHDGHTHDHSTTVDQVMAELS